MNNRILAINLLACPEIGRATVRKIVDGFGSLEPLLSNSPECVSEKCGINIEKARLACERVGTGPGETVMETCRREGFRLYVYGEADYPALLSEIYDPPAVIYCEGELKQSDYNSVAVVGTRKASQYGKAAARFISSGLAARGITVVSGCAAGIDAVAHRGAIEAGGRTVAVLGSGLKKRYPVCNVELMKNISLSGAVISEFGPDEEAVPHNFPQRNRIVSGLSLGTVIIEAPERSGALITASLALDQGREVYAVPGTIFSRRSRGCLELIKSGARPLTDPEEILEDLAGVLNRRFMKTAAEEPAPKQGPDAGRTIMEALGPVPVHIDKLKRETKIDMNTLARELTRLEIAGRARRLNGNSYVKI